MKEVFTFFSGNWEALLGALVLIVGVVVKLTPGKKDNYIFKVCVKIINIIKKSKKDDDTNRPFKKNE